MEPSRSGLADLFGRGMVYVLVWSLQLITATIVSPVLAHTLPMAEFGSLAAAIALYQLLIILAVLGLDQALEIQRVEDRDATTARGLLAAGMVFAFTLAGILVVTSRWWAPVLGFDGSATDPISSQGGLVLITLTWTAPGATVLLMLSLLQAEDRLRRFSVISILSTVGGLVIGLTLLLGLGPRTAEVYALGGVIAQAAAMLLGLVWTRPRWRGLADLRNLRRAWALGVPLVMASLAQFALSAGDRFAIQRVLGEAETARYQVAWTVGNALTLILVFTNRAWLPRLKRITDTARRWTVIAAARDGIWMLLGWAVLGLTVASPALLRTLAPPDYRPDELVPVVLVVALGALPAASIAASGQLLITVRRSAPLAWSSGLAVVIKVAVTAATLQSWGTLGAAVGTVTAVCGQAVALRIAVSRHVPWHRIRLRLLLFWVVVAAMAASSLWWPTSTGWLIGRFLGATALLVPFGLALRRIGQTGPSVPGMRDAPGKGTGAGSTQR